MSEQQQTTSIATIMPNIFGDIDFNGLNTAIDTIADFSGELSDGEKQSGLQIIDSWKQNVLDVLEEKKVEAERCLRTFDPSIGGIFIDEDDFEDIIMALDLNDKYVVYKDLFEQLRELDSSFLSCPSQELNQTYEDYLQKKHAYELEIERKRTEQNRLRRKTAKALMEIKTELVQNTSIKELTNRAKKFKKNITKFNRECQSKSDLAKISISISSEKIRESLKDLMSFTVSI